MAEVYGWLRSTAANRCVDLTRSAKIRESKTPYITDYYTNHSPDLFELDDKKAAIIERLMERVNKLPERNKNIFLMRCFDGLKFKEIAAILNKDISTIKKRYARAIEIIKKDIMYLLILIIIYLL